MTEEKQTMTTTEEVMTGEAKRVAMIVDRDQYDRLMTIAKKEKRSGRQQLAVILQSYLEEYDDGTNH